MLAVGSSVGVRLYDAATFAPAAGIDSGPVFDFVTIQEKVAGTQDDSSFAGDGVTRSEENP
jgi:hypothetical protein